MPISCGMYSWQQTMRAFSRVQASRRDHLSNQQQAIPNVVDDAIRVALQGATNPNFVSSFTQEVEQKQRQHAVVSRDVADGRIGAPRDVSQQQHKEKGGHDVFGVVRQAI